MVTYATRDNESNTISTGAFIEKFTNEEDAKIYLLSHYPEEYYDHSSAKFSYGSFADCWLKFYPSNFKWNDEYYPFTSEQINVLPPHQNPGGRQYWITPISPILIIQFISERE